MAAELEALCKIISTSIDNILDRCSKESLTFPSIHKPAESVTEEVRNDPEIAVSINLLVAAAAQLIATVRPPAKTLFINAYSWTMSSCLGVAEAANVSEILRDAGSKGMHANEIAQRSGVGNKKLTRVLRYLASSHIFEEVSPDVFANNLLSSLLDTGKPADAIQDDHGRLSKYDNTTSMAAVVNLATDEAAKSGSYLKEHLLDPNTTYSDEPNVAALQRALNSNEHRFEFVELASQKARHRRYGPSMVSLNALQPPKVLSSVFDRSTIPQGGILVDVGGGIGHVSLEIAKLRPDLNIIIEDRALVLEQAKEFWQAFLPSYVLDGKVQFSEIDFFQPHQELNPPANVFLLRAITHDWSDSNCIKLLSNLRKVASPTAKLVIFDCLIEPSCKHEYKDAPYLNKDIPFPLLANLGGADIASYSMDITMMTVLNAYERTIGDFDYILKSSGWKLNEIKRSTSNSGWWPCIISTPA